MRPAPATDLIAVGLFDAVVNNDLEQKFVSLDREGTDWGWLIEPTINDIGLKTTEKTDLKHKKY